MSTDPVCLLCGASTRLVLDLGATPLANELRASAHEKQEKYPLRLVRCAECGHLQLDQHVAPERLYGPGYVYATANDTHQQAFAQEMQSRFACAFVVDVGGNDGALMDHFRGDTLVVDPAGGDRAIRALFDGTSAKGIVASHGKPDLITANNVFAHNADLAPILKGVKALLAPMGAFVLEVAYALPMLQDGLFDLVYHEHIHHWTLGSLARYLEKNGLRLFDAEIVPTHGGSLRAYARVQAKTVAVTPRAQAILRVEARDMENAVTVFPARVRAEREAYHKALKHVDGSMGVLGYPAKACTLLSYLNAGTDALWVFDDNPKKIGKFTPWAQRIEPVCAIAERDPKWLLVASWNYADEMIARVKAAGYHGKFLRLHPVRAEA